MEGGGGRSGVVVDIDAAVDDDGGSRTRPWVRVDAETGESEEMELSKQAVMRRMGVPARDLRALDPLLGYTASILARGYAIVCNLEQIRCIISSEEALVMRVQGDQGDDDAAARYADELKRRLAAGRHAAAGMPFELIAFGVALECISSVFKSETADIEIEAYPALDELAKKVSTLNLERARRLKSRLAALTKRVQRDVLRNQLLKFELLLGSAGFVVGMFGVVPGVFGMDFEGVTLYKVPHAFEETIGITGACSLLMFGCFMWYLKRRLFF